ncbi:hypothetical protein IQ07DRAFT_187377 [Pyrenochaeta sp. DS3sAY3a]|nr:hypothetical protein IQ07DRAFT_187377 [Pyrenochaeta sp. DS3sAY3a]
MESNQSASAPHSFKPETQSTQETPLNQLDGSTGDRQWNLNQPSRSHFFPPQLPPVLPRHPHPHHQTHIPHHNSINNTLPVQNQNTPQNVVQHLLPYCTTEPPLTAPQVIALSDAAGTLRELVLLALGAATGDIEFAARVENSVGSQAALNIVEFFADEWEIDG